MAVTYNPIQWVGEEYAEIFSEVIYSAPTFEKDLVRVIQNIKSKEVITSLGGAPVVQPYALKPVASGSLNFSDATLFPVKSQVFDKFDPNQVLHSRFSKDMAAGASNMESNTYMNAMKAYLTPRITKAIERKFWDIITGVMTGSTTNVDRVGAALSVTNVLDEIKGVYAALPGEVLTTGEQILYLPEAAKQLVMIANSERTYRDLLTVEGDTIKYLDLPLAFVPLAANTLIAGRSSDFLLGTDLLADYGALEVGKVEAISDEMFYKLTFTLDGAVCAQAQKVLSKPA